MLHHKKFRKFGREKNERKAFIKGLMINLFTHGRIETTVARAKELRSHVERLVTIGKVDTVSNRRNVAAKIYNNQEIVKKIFTEYAPKYKDVNGGYTRIIKLGRRIADGAEKAVIEFV